MTCEATIAKPTLKLPEFVTLMALMTSLVALSIDAMLPALDQIGHELGSQTVQETHLIVSLFFFGMAFGQLFYGPFADTKGRRAAILSGLIIFAIGTLICMFAENMTVMLIGRVIQAFGVSGPRIASLALIRDQYAGDAMARVMSFIMMVFILVPMIAPAFGQAILFAFGWSHIFTSFLVIGSGIALWFFSRHPETLPASKRQPFKWRALWISTKFILTHKLVMGYILAMGFVFGAFLAYLSASQTIFEGIFKVGELFPMFFALLAFSIGLASFINGSLVMRFGMLKLIQTAVVGLIVTSGLLVALAMAYAGVPPVWYFVGLLFINFFWVGVLFGNLNSMAMLPMGKMAGLGAAVIGCLSSLISVPISIFIGDFVHSEVTPIALGFLLFGLLTAGAVMFAGKPRQEPLV